MAAATTFSLFSRLQICYEIRSLAHQTTTPCVKEPGFRQAGLPVSVWKSRKTLNTNRIKAVATTAVEEANVYILPTWAEFDLGLAPVYWKTNDGLPPSSGGKLTLFYNPSNKLAPADEFGIAFNGGFNQPIMCGGERRAMTRKDRGQADPPFFTIKINVPQHAVNLIFSFTNGVDWMVHTSFNFKFDGIGATDRLAFSMRMTEYIPTSRGESINELNISGCKWV